MKIVYSWILTGIFAFDSLAFSEVFETISLICSVEKRCKRYSLQMADVRLG